MQPSQETLDAILAPYQPELRHLNHVEIITEPITALGVFNPGQSEYQDPWRHITNVQVMQCLPQLSYALIATLLEHEEPVPGLATNLDLFYNSRADWLIRSVTANYKAQTPPGQFFGEVKLAHSREINHHFIAQLSYDFNDGAVTGRLLLRIPNRPYL